jgi:F-type H+-transporting ATPase subunit delta
MISSTISLRYTNALLELCDELQQTDAVYEDMKELQNLLYESYELRNLLRTPQIDDFTKSRLIRQLFTSCFQELTIRFLTLLIRKGRSKLVIYIVHQFIEIYREKRNITLAMVKSTVKLTDDMKLQIIEKVKLATGKEKVEIKEHINKQLLGGFILQFDGKSYDASIKRKLEKIKHKLSVN